MQSPKEKLRNDGPLPYHAQEIDRMNNDKKGTKCIMYHEQDLELGTTQQNTQKSNKE